MRWWAWHGVWLAAVAVIVIYAARGNWFFYDEWDFLRADMQWNLLAPHNGHLSFFPRLLTASVESVFGIGSYWPYLAWTIAAHLAVVHMLWRLMMRSGVAPVLAVALPAVFGVLASGGENTLWAFQVGFITPIVTGIAALLIAMRPELGVWDPVRIAVLLLIGVGFASTALPLVVAVCVYLVVRHGWRSAMIPFGAFVLVYGVWYLAFARGTTGADGFGVTSLSQLVIGVPEYVAYAFIDSLGKTLPAAALAPALLVAVIIGAVVDISRRPLRDIGPAYALLLAALGFALLTAFTRVGLGVENASTGRYVYIYAALAVPVVGLLLTSLVRRSGVATAVVAALLAVVFVFNAGGLVREGRNQAELERTVERTISAALTLDAPASAEERSPASVVAPTLTMRDVQNLVDDGTFTPVPFTPADLLSARVNLLLTAEPVTQEATDGACRTADGGWVPFDLAADLLTTDQAGFVNVVVTQDGVQSFGTRIPVHGGGTFLLDGIGPADTSVLIDTASAGGVCVLPR